MELTPRTSSEHDAGTVGARRRRSGCAYGVLVLVAAALVVVVWQALTSASLYFYNADEAVEQRAELASKRFRLQGVVMGETVRETAAGVTFAVTFNGAVVEVQHEGDPPQLFQEGIPVVLEGAWSRSGDVYVSDTIKVKHSATYEAENPDRLEDAEDGRSGAAPSSDEP